MTDRVTFVHDASVQFNTGEYRTIRECSSDIDRKCRQYRDEGHKDVDRVSSDDSKRNVLCGDLGALEYRLGVEKYLQCPTTNTITST